MDIDNPMPESTLSLGKGLWIWPLEYYDLVNNTGMEELGDRRKVVFVQFVSDIHLRSWAGVCLCGGGVAAPSLPHWTHDAYRLSA